MKFLITESKLKQFIQKKFGVDLTGRIKMIRDYNDLPDFFRVFIPKENIIFFIDKYGPMYVIIGDSETYLYQNQDGNIIIANSLDYTVDYYELMEDLGIEYGMGLSIDDLIDTYVKEN